MIRHIVVDGQTAAEVAQRYGVSFEDLMQFNGLTADQTLVPGVMLWLPESGAAQANATSAGKEPVLRVPENLFGALHTLKDGNGSVRLRIVRGRQEEPLSLQLL
ncbi:MAG: LysM peptidoglycan-binding domain-containing protein [Betaproteobacteria bacterium]